MIEDKELGKLFNSIIDSQPQEYESGAWENFVKIRKRRQRALRTYIFAGAAAIFIALFTLFGIITPIKVPRTSIKQNIALNSAEKESAVENKPTTVIEQSIPKNKKLFRNQTELVAQNLKTGEDSAVKLKPISEVQVNNESNTINKSSIEERVISDKSKDSTKYKNQTNSVTLEYFDSNQKESKHRKLRYGVNLAPGISSTSKSSGFNISAGVSVDIPLSKQIEISTGIQIEHSKMAESINTLNNAIPSVHENFSLTNLDIPVNIKWHISQTKSEGFYLSGGISSVACLEGDVNTTSYRQELRESQMSSISGPDKTVYKLEMVETKYKDEINSAGKFDFAGRINLMFGYSRTISPKLKLHLEPYFKIPISGSLNREIRFTTTGITCKISF